MLKISGNFEKLSEFLRKFKKFKDYKYISKILGWAPDFSLIGSLDNVPNILRTSK